MTRPIELKPREDESPGTPYEDYETGAPLPDMWFTVTPAIAEEYLQSVDGDASLYRVDGRQAAPPNVLAVYLLAILYRKYPPNQGLILTDVAFRFHHPIWADEDTEICGNGEVIEKIEKRGKHFVRWAARFTRKDGVLIATARNTVYVPIARYEKR